MALRESINLLLTQTTALATALDRGDFTKCESLLVKREEALHLLRGVRERALAQEMDACRDLADELWRQDEDLRKRFGDELERLGRERARVRGGPRLDKTAAPLCLNRKA